jgi:hypothetical protein
MKRRDRLGDAEELSFHLSTVQGCLVRTLHVLFANERSITEVAQQMLLQSCLHFYNALEEGLNYMEDRPRSIPEVEGARLVTEQLLEAMEHIDSVEGEAEQCCAMHLPMHVSMLHNTLCVLLEEMRKTDYVPETAADDGIRSMRGRFS